MVKLMEILHTPNTLPVWTFNHMDMMTKVMQMTLHFCFTRKNPFCTTSETTKQVDATTIAIAWCMQVLPQF